MCEEKYTLAESDPTRAITLCEHGSVNLFWDNCAIYLPLETVLELQTSVEEEAPQLVLGEYTSIATDVLELSLTSSGGVKLWLRNIGFQLTIHDFITFRGVLQKAVNEYYTVYLKRFKYFDEPKSLKA